MKFVFLFVLLFQTRVSFSQACNCTDEFLFIKNHIEKNHGGFNRKIKSPDSPAYKKFAEGILKEIKNSKDAKYCIVYLKKYILYLQDHHSSISWSAGNVVNENSPASLDSFLKSKAFTTSERISMDSAAIMAYLQNPLYRNIEGIYQTPDNTYKVALIRNKTPNRDYVAIILESKTKLWVKGQVKFELKQATDSSLHYFAYLRNHGLNYEEIPYSNDEVHIPGWEKQTSPVVVKGPVVDNKLVRFSIIDSQTTVLSIRSFSSSVYKILDSVYKKVIPEIKKYPHLIIDVRNNGGGADFAYYPLMPLLYTDTIYNDVVDIYNTPGNRVAYKKFDSLSVKGGNNPVFSRSIGLMDKGKPYTFIPMGTGVPSTSVFPVNSGYPQKIAILYNKSCASSCESLLFDAMFSRKTIFAGENSGGYTGYGDVMSITTPCGNTLSWTTTVYRDQWKYEFVGIPPHFRIPGEEKDWVEYTRRLLAK